MRIIAWAHFTGPGEKEILDELVKRCLSKAELFLELRKLMPDEETFMIHLLAERLVNDNINKKNNECKKV